MRLRALAAALALAAAAAAPARAWGAARPAAAPPAFGLVPAPTLRRAGGQVAALEAAAGGETFLDRMLGTSCYSRAVADLRAGCAAMDPPAKTRLALRLANCQLATQGQATFPCAEAEPLKRCVERLPDREHGLYVEFLTHADEMCLFVQNQEFERYAEALLNQLAAGAGYAREQLAEVGARTAALTDAAAGIAASAAEALGRLGEQRELTLGLGDALRAHRADAAAHHAALAASQREALDLGGRTLAQAAALDAAQRAAAARLDAHGAAVGSVFGAVREQAAAAAAAQGAAAAAQRELAAQLAQLADGSRGLRAAVDVVAEYQRRSDAALVRVLGASYGAADAAFYAAGAAAAWAAGAAAPTAAARLPLLALLASGLAAERALLGRLAPRLELDPATGGAVLPLAPPAWLAWAAAPRAVDVKWAVRRALGALGAALLVAAARAHRGGEAAARRVLEDAARRVEEIHAALLGATGSATLAQRLADLRAAEGGGGGREKAPADAAPQRPPQRQRHAPLERQIELTIWEEEVAPAAALPPPARAHLLRRGGSGTLSREPAAAAAAAAAPPRAAPRSRARTTTASEATSVRGASAAAGASARRRGKRTTAGEDSEPATSALPGGGGGGAPKPKRPRR
jgi:hypothetical protein